MTSRFLRSAALAALATAACLALTGCGSNTVNASGSVTFKGKPVPAGKIYFLPDGSKGNTGQAGYADIKDGRYDTAAGGGKGFAPGAVIVAIEGLDPNEKPNTTRKGEEGEAPAAKVLFARWETADNISSTTSKDFLVPDSASKGPVAPTGLNPGATPP